MATTTTKSIPYPQTTDNNANTTDIQNLAQWVDDMLGPFTTTQRNALSAALKWVGREIYNSTTKQKEMWDGTTWQVVGYLRGELKWWSGDKASPPAGWLVCGTVVSRTTYADLAAMYAAMTPTYPWGAGDGTSTFRAGPDANGRTLVAFDDLNGTDAGRLSSANTYGTAGGNETVTLGATQVPLVNHDHGGLTGVQTADHTHGVSINTGTESADHAHGLVGCFTDAQGAHYHGVGTGGSSGFVTDGPGNNGPAGVDTGVSFSFATVTSTDGNHAHNVFGGTGGRNAAHYHLVSGNTGGISANHQHAITAASAAASAPVSLMQPFIGAVLLVKY